MSLSPRWKDGIARYSTVRYRLAEHAYLRSRLISTLNICRCSVCYNACLTFQDLVLGFFWMASVPCVRLLGLGRRASLG
jgi:hypothetical protein